MFSAGYKIGDYELLEQLGAGGFATVWRAHHPARGDVAIKVLHRNLLRARPLESGPTVAQRFIAEASIIRKLNSPGFVEIYDVIHDEAAGFVAYVMEVLPGKNLAECILSISLQSLLEVTATVAETLHSLHQAKIIHRDVKASNIFLCTSTPEIRPFDVKVIDFGIAKDLSQERLLESTATGYFIGTVARMPPECFRRWTHEDSSVMGPMVDQWGLGITLFYLLTGTMPFGNDTLVGLIRKIEDGDRQPLLMQGRFQVPKAPRDLEAFLNHCLAADPRQRFSDMAALAKELRVLAANCLSWTTHADELEQTVVVGDEQDNIINTEIMEIDDYDRIKTDQDYRMETSNSSNSGGASSRTAAGSRGTAGNQSTKLSAPATSQSVSGVTRSPNRKPEKTSTALRLRKRRIIVTAEGQAIPVGTNKSLSSQMQDEARASTFVVEIDGDRPVVSQQSTRSPLVTSNPNPVLDGLQSSELAYTMKPNIPAGLDSADTLTPVIPTQTEETDTTHMSVFTIGLVCIAAGFLSYVIVWWIRNPH
jgi:serine/threonine protein kinase